MRKRSLLLLTGLIALVGSLVAIGLLLEDCTMENGPMLVLRGSHKGPVVHDHNAEGRFCGAIDPEATRRYIDDIGTESDRLQRLTEDLLVLSRAEGNRLEVAANPIALAHVVRCAAEIDHRGARRVLWPRIERALGVGVEIHAGRNAVLPDAEDPGPGVFVRTARGGNVR